MRLARLTLRRFRSHASFERRFDGRPVAIVGANGAGKTNILEAISLLSPGRGLRGATVEEMAGRPDPIGWSVAAELVDDTGATRAARLTVNTADGARVAVSLDDAADSRTALGRLAPMLWLTPAMDRLWTDATAERRRFVDRLALALEPSHGLVAAAYERAMRERAQLLKAPTPDAAWLDAIEARQAEAGLTLAAARLAAVSALAAAQEAARTTFPAADLALVGPFEATPPEDVEAFRARLRRDRRPDAEAGRTGYGPHRSDLHAVYREKSAPARLCSTGEQKALLVSLVLAAARAVTARVGRPPLLLFDEIAAHFDADRRAALFDEIVALGAQAFLTGAEAAPFEALGARAERIEL